MCLYLPQIWGARGVHVPLLANLELEQLTSRGGLWSGMGYQLGGGPMLVQPGYPVNVGTMRDKRLSAVCFASEHQAGPASESGTCGLVRGPRIWLGWQAGEEAVLEGVRMCVWL